MILNHIQWWLDKLCFFPELHRQYINTPSLIEGDEYIKHALKFSPQPVIDKTSAQANLIYQQIEDEFWVHLIPGMFALFFPHDIHRPCCHRQHSCAIKKAVHKINLH